MLTRPQDPNLQLTPHSRWRTWLIGVVAGAALTVSLVALRACKDEEPRPSVAPTAPARP